jgi:hypothetical protein
LLRLGGLILVTAMAAPACGGGDSVAVAIPDDATFCSVFLGEYTAALSDAAPATDDGFGAASGRITAWAEALVSLAPGEIGDQAKDNLLYHQAQAELRSAAEFIPGSIEMHAWANANCG